MLFGSNDNHRHRYLSPTTSTRRMGNAVTYSKRHHILDGLGESTGRGMTTCGVISCPHQSDRGVFALVEPNVLQQSQKASLPPPAGETWAAPDGNIALVAHGSQRLFGRCAIIALLQRSTK